MLFTRQTIRIKPSTTSSCLNRFTSAKLEIATGSHKCHIKSCCLHTVQVRYITVRRYLFIHRPLVETSSRWGGPCIKSLDPTILENPCWSLKGWLFIILKEVTKKYQTVLMIFVFFPKSSSTFSYLSPTPSSINSAIPLRKLQRTAVSTNDKLLLSPGLSSRCLDGPTLMIRLVNVLLSMVLSI